jgi:caspase-like apoptosis-related cysteine protease
LLTNIYFVNKKNIAKFGSIMRYDKNNILFIFIVANMDHTQHDCLIVAVLSHGELGLLYAHDTAYKADSLWYHFTPDKCPTLAGKPKLFFIQACQGDKLDAGVTLKERTETDGLPSATFRIPTQADFLIAYSTVPGIHTLLYNIKYT